MGVRRRGGRKEEHGWYKGVRRRMGGRRGREGGRGEEGERDAQV